MTKEVTLHDLWKNVREIDELEQLHISEMIDDQLESMHISEMISEQEKSKEKERVRYHRSYFIFLEKLKKLTVSFSLI